MGREVSEGGREYQQGQRNCRPSKRGAEPAEWWVSRSFPRSCVAMSSGTLLIKPYPTALQMLQADVERSEESPGKGGGRFRCSCLVARGYLARLSSEQIAFRARKVVGVGPI